MNEKTDAMADTVEYLPEVSEMKLELTKDERIRATALMMGIRYYTDTIIKDADYLRVMLEREKEAKFSNTPEDKALWHLRPASVHGVIFCAQEFEEFLLGNRPSMRVTATHPDGRKEEVEPQDDPSRRGAQPEVEQES